MTNQERTQSICNGIVNGVATVPQMLAFAEAIYARKAPLASRSFTELTTAEKWSLIPEFIRETAVTLVREHDKAKALAAAPDTSGTVLPLLP